MKKPILLHLLALSLFADSVEIEPITVYSTKLQNNLLDNANSVDVVNAAKIEQSKSKNIRELSALISNTNISGIGSRNNVTINLRGVNNYVAYESSVAVYVDDVPIPISYGFGLVDMYNIQSLELLKGAQGTLFGKSAESGVINIYTKAPTKETKIELSAGYADYNTKEFYASASGATTMENLNYALSITKNSTDGYSTNAITGANFDTRDFLSFSGKLLYKPTTAFSIALNYTRSESDDGGAPYKVNTKENPYLIEGEPSNDFVQMQSDQLSLVLKYEEDDTLLSSTTSFTKFSMNDDDYVGILGGLTIVRDVDIEELTQEFKYKQKFEDADLLVGLYYSDKIAFDYGEDQTLLTLYPIPLSSKNNLQNPDQNIALFAQYRYYFAENYSVMAGLRYQETKRSFSRVLNNFGEGPTYASDETTWSHLLPTLSFSYYGDDDSHSYLTYTKGYRPGGYGYRSSDLLDPFKPETTDSYELGYKKSWDNTLTLATALFYNNITDHRINTFTDTLSSIVLNADKAYSYGAEVELHYKSDDLQLYSSLGWVETEYEKFNDADYTQYEGNKLLDTPNITASIGIKYNLHENLYLSGYMRYMGERYYNIENTAKLDAYTTLNLGAGYERDGWLVELYASNILDKRYVDFMIYTPSNDYYHFGAPRVIGVKVSKTF